MAEYCRAVRKGRSEKHLQERNATWCAAAEAFPDNQSDDLLEETRIFVAVLCDRLAAAERDIAEMDAIIGELVDPKHLTSEDAETLNRIRQRAKDKG